MCRQLALAWGVRPRRLPAHNDTDDIIEDVMRKLRAEKLARGSRAVLVMGGAHDPAGTTTLVKLLTL